MPDTICSQIRKIIYSLYKPTCEVIEYYDHGDNHGMDGIPLMTTLFKKGNMYHWLDALEFPQESIDVVKQLKKTNNELYKEINDIYYEIGKYTREHEDKFYGVKEYKRGQYYGN